MALIWKRVKDRSNENHPMKCLILLEFLLREGNADMVMKQIQKNLVCIEQLKHFTLYNEHQQDLGIKGARRPGRNGAVEQGRDSRAAAVGASRALCGARLAHGCAARDFSPRLVARSDRFVLPSRLAPASSLCRPCRGAQCAPRQKLSSPSCETTQPSPHLRRE